MPVVFPSSLLRQREQQFAAFQALPPEQQAALISDLQGANLAAPPQEDDDGPFSFLGAVPGLNLVGRAAKQIGEALIYTPVGLYETGKAIGFDVRDIATGRDFTPGRTTELGGLMAHQIAEDFRHPLRNIGYLGMDLFAAASLGAGAASRLGAAGRAGRAYKAERRFPDDGGETGPPVGFPQPQGGPYGGIARERDVTRGFVDEDAAALDRLESSRVPAQQAERFPNEPPFAYEPPPLVPGHLYSVTHKTQPNRYNIGRAYYKGTETRGKRGTYHVFIDEQGAVRRINENQVGSLNLMERIRSDALPEGSPGLRRGTEVGRETSASQFGHLQPRPLPDLAPEAAPAAPLKGLLSPKEIDAIAAGKAAYSPGTAAREAVAETRISEVAAAEKSARERVARAREQEAELVPAAPSPRYQVERKGSGAIGEELADGSRFIVAPHPEQAGRFTVLSAAKGKKPVVVVEQVSNLDDAVVQARRLGDEARGIVETEKGLADVDAVMKEPPQPVPKFAMPKRPTDVPKKTFDAVVKDLRVAYREAGGKVPGPQAVYEIALKHGFDDAAARNLAADAFKVRGGAPETMHGLIGAMVKGFTRPDSPGMRKIELFTPEAPQSGKPQVRRRTEGGMIESGQLAQARVVLSRNPLVRSVQNYRLDLLERRQSTTGPRLVNLRREIEFQNRESMRILQMATDGGIMEQARKVAEAVKAEKRTPKRTVGDLVDTMNMAAKLGTLFLKPAYVPANMIGQIWLVMTDHAWRPDHILKTVRLQRSLYGGSETRFGRIVGKRVGVESSPLHAKRRAEKIKNAMSEGIARSLREERGFFDEVPLLSPEGRIVGYNDVVNFYNKILDEPWRDNAFIHEAIRHGFDTPEKLARLVDDPAQLVKFEEIARRANRNIIDYGRLGPNEKNLVRRIIFFYPWLKGATIYGAHFMAEHPLQAGVSIQLGHAGQEEQERLLGPIPSYLKGAFKVGDRNVPGLGKVPTIINPAAASVLGTPGEVLESALAAIQGGRTEASAASQHLTPAVSSLIAAATGKDPFTGGDIDPRESWPETIINQFGNTIAIKRMLDQRARAREIEAGTRDPREVLFPYSEDEAFGRFVVGTYPYALNPAEARSRAAAEQRTLETKRQREVLKHRDYGQLYLQAGRSTGQFAQLPSELSQALAARGQRYAEYAAVEESSNRNLREIDRLRADVALLIRRGIFKEEDARELLIRMASAPESTVQSLRRQFTEAYFGGSVISQYKANLNAAGAGLTVP